jgi:nucleotide-binding universal stress UspA family protein
MNAKKILFPTDLSHTGDAALTYAASLARESGGHLLIVHVQEPPLAYGGGEMYYGLPEVTTEELRRMLHVVKPADSSIAVEHRLIDGDPVGAIVRFAEQEGVDLIVVGSHGRRGLTRMLMGSVAEGIVRKAHCPVLVCKPAVGKSTVVTAS